MALMLKDSLRGLGRESFHLYACISKREKDDHGYGINDEYLGTWLTELIKYELY